MINGVIGIEREDGSVITNCSPEDIFEDVSDYQELGEKLNNLSAEAVTNLLEDSEDTYEDDSVGDAMLEYEYADIDYYIINRRGVWKVMLLKTEVEKWLDLESTI